MKLPLFCQLYGKFYEFEVPERADKELRENLENSVSSFKNSWDNAVIEWGRRVKRKEFEEKFGQQLIFNRKRARISAYALSTVSSLVITLILTSNNLNPFEGLKNVLTGNFHWLELVSALVMCAFISFSIKEFFISALTSKEEKRLWMNFNSRVSRVS